MINRRICAGLALAVVFTSCTRLAVDSTPPDARVLWSPTGVDGWRPWPPAAWKENTPSLGDAPTTPLRTNGTYGDTIWITVEKDGYHRPLPQTAQLYAFRREHLSFDLVETAEARATRLAAEGLVSYQGQWVDPKAYNLVQVDGVWIGHDEAERLENEAKGLVLYNNEWMTPDKRDERERADMEAKGLVFFKDRWVSPEVRAEEQRLDALMDVIANSDHASLSLPRVVGRVDAPDARLEFINESTTDVRFVLSGPQTREIVILAQSKSDTAWSVLPGRYRIAAFSAADISHARTAFVAHPLAGGYHYQIVAENEFLDQGPESVEKYTIPLPPGILPEQ